MTVAEEAPKKRSPLLLWFLLVVLVLITGALVATAAHGIRFGWLAPYWAGLTEAQSNIITQVLFIFAAAWAAVLVPLLFAEQLQNLEQAAKRAEKTYAHIEALMERAAEESRAQFESITRIQVSALGYLVDPRQLDALQSPEARKAYVENAWANAKRKLDAAMARQNGNRRNAIDLITSRSGAWWDKLAQFEVLGSYHDQFKMISEKCKKQKLDPEDLHIVNEATRKIAAFAPAPPADGLSAAQMPIITKPIDQSRELPH